MKGECDMQALIEAFFRGAGLAPSEGWLALAGFAVLTFVAGLALLALLLREADSPNWTKRRCGRCAETSSGLAHACRHCGQAFGVRA
jgi:hypothetical protein